MLSKDRSSRVIDELCRRGSDAVFIGPSADLEYLTGLEIALDARTKGLFITKDGGACVLAPMLYQEELINAVGPDIPAEIWADHEGSIGAFRRIMSKLDLNGKKIEINAGLSAVDLIEMQRASDAVFINGSSLLSPIRSRKDAPELELMREASRIADAVMGDIASFIKKGMTEGEVKKFLVERFRDRGGTGLSFPPIVASGPNGSMPHYNAESRVLADGDFVIVDMGCRYERYCSDITRTFCVGVPTDEMLKIYDIVLKSQEAGEAAVIPGAAGEQVDRAARKIIEDAGYGDRFLNRVGHGIGIAVHEAPYIIEGNDIPLVPGNVFSVEPGIYIPGKFGVRIEDLVAVKEDGYGEVLNSFTKELIRV